MNKDGLHQKQRKETHHRDYWNQQCWKNNSSFCNQRKFVAQQKKETRKKNGNKKKTNPTNLDPILFLPAEVDQFTTPTWGFDSETIKNGSHTITFYDMGGGETFRGIWKHYFAEVHGIIFVVDSADSARIEEAKAVLHANYNSSNLKGKRLLVLVAYLSFFFFFFSFQRCGD